MGHCPIQVGLCCRHCNMEGMLMLQSNMNLKIGICQVDTDQSPGDHVDNGPLCLHLESKIEKPL